MAEFQESLKPFAHLEVHWLKSERRARALWKIKRDKESEMLLQKISKDKKVILFDSIGIMPKDSVDFSRRFFSSVPPSGAQMIVGGAFGVNDQVRSRADTILSLSSLTFNHQVACLVALEQVYRAFMIRSGKPYHNAESG